MIKDLRVLHRLLQMESRPLFLQALCWGAKTISHVMTAAWHGITLCMCGMDGCDVERPSASSWEGAPMVVVFVDDLDR